MTRARRKPADAVRSYGVLVGKVIDGFESPEGASPHYEIHLDGGRSFRVAVNVQSVDDSEVLAYFDPDFGTSGSLDLTPYLDGPRGFRALPTGPGATGGLDYLRDNLFSIQSMRPIPAAGSGVSLANLLDANIERAKADSSAVLIAFGEHFEDAGQTDKYFGFRPERGLHDVHMMQGNTGNFASDNRVHGDGALFLCFNNRTEIAALFVRFQTQSVHTNDTTGAPVDTGP
ncbi:MAG TPA: DUF2278 family protein [Xanthobacteraceae bacterium]